MTPREIESRTETMLTPIAEQYGCRVYDVDYAKDGSEWFLTCYIDKDGGVTLDDCEAVNRAMSDALDADEFIQDAYTLVVSSPGLGRRLTKDRHFAQSIGMEVEGTTFRPVITDPGAAGMEIPVQEDGTMTKTAKKKAARKKKALSGTKEFHGILKAFDKDTVTLELDGGGEPAELVIERNNLAMIRLHVDF